MDAMAALITSTSCTNLYSPSLQMQFQPPPPQLLQHSPYFPNLQMQFHQPPPPPPPPQLPPQPQHFSSSCCCLVGMNDDELLNLAAAATCGFNFEENMLFDSTNYYNNYEQSNYDLQIIPFHCDLDSFIHFPNQQLQTLEALNSPLCHNLELPPKTLTTATALLSSVNNDGDRKRVTAQSLAARERRRKITRKTQELGKLIPGGTKMNTAQMLQSAFKYIQFLQSQLQLLQLLPAALQGSNKEKAAPPLHMVASPVIQQKLYMEGCCIIPRAFAQTLLRNINDSSISEELRGIID